MSIFLLLIAFFVVRRAFWGYAKPTRNYKHLTRVDVAVLHAVGEVMFPAGGALSPSYDDAGVVEYTDDYFGWHQPRNRFLMHLLFVLIEHATLVFMPSFQRFSQLSIDKRTKYLNGWSASPIYMRRMVFESLRAILCMAYMGDATVEKEMGIYRPDACEQASVLSRQS